MPWPGPDSRIKRLNYLGANICGAQETRNGLEAAGFEIVQFRQTTEAVKAYDARSRAMVDRGEKPPHRAVQLMHGDIAPLAMKNTVRGVAEGSLIPVEILSRKRG